MAKKYLVNLRIHVHEYENGMTTEVRRRIQINATDKKHLFERIAKLVEIEAPLQTEWSDSGV